jgi:hypothetical protein
MGRYWTWHWNLIKIRGNDECEQVMKLLKRIIGMICKEKKYEDAIYIDFLNRPYFTWINGQWQRIEPKNDILKGKVIN